ncbi:MAG: CDP-glycerol glycerophosphotransferase family protein [Oscillospiraceae bacterium]|nr:CDP-glycerol glycerophosphotransferase family protein [Oscillospiraceae bacterium]
MKLKDLVKTGRQLAGKALTVLNKMVPKRKDLILFIGNDGLTDNNLAMFEHLTREGWQENRQIVCAVKNHESYAHLAEKNVRFVSLKRGLFTYLRAGVAFYCNGTYPVKPSKNQLVINLWHGTPLKKICRLAPNVSQYDYDYFTYVLAASEMFVPIMAQCFGVPEEKVLLCGHARNDVLFREPAGVMEKLTPGKDFAKLLLWMPTFRTSYNDYIQDGTTTRTGLPIFEDMAQMEAFNEKLKAENALMVIKLHPMQKLSDIAGVDFSNIVLLTNPDLRKMELPLYELVARADALITDYSSIYFDYLLLDRPIGFTCDDLDAYDGSRGFVVDDPLAFMPGMKIKDCADFSAFAEKALAGDDGWAAERARINDLVNTYKDGESAARLLGLVGLTKGKGNVHA